MATTTEFDILEGLLPELKAEGYEVFVRPTRALLPLFLHGYTPDAIALRDDKKIAIEVVRTSEKNSEKLGRISALFEGQHKWELRVVFLDPGVAETLSVQPLQAIGARINEIRELADKGHREVALLLGWATFEAIARAAMKEQFGRAQTPGRLVQVLASEGYIMPDEADKLRELAGKRNKLIHGELGVVVSALEIDELIAILGTLRQHVAS